MGVNRVGWGVAGPIIPAKAGIQVPGRAHGEGGAGVVAEPSSPWERERITMRG